MKLKKIISENIGIIEQIEVEITKPLNIFSGKTQQGKTTILNCVKWCLGGSYPDDIIQHGKTEAKIILQFDNGVEAMRKFYFAKKRNSDEKYISDALTVKKEGFTKEKPVEYLQGLINPFSLDQDYFNKMTLLNQNRFMAEHFDTDTVIQDEEIKRLGDLNINLRIEIKSAGNIDLTVIEKPNIDNLNTEKQKIVDAYNKEHGEIKDKLNNKYLDNKKQNDKLRADFQAEKDKLKAGIEAFNNKQTEFQTNILAANMLYESIEERVAEFCNAYDFKHDLSDFHKHISAFPKSKAMRLYTVESEQIKQPEYINPEIPDSTELDELACDTFDIDEKISNTKADQLRYETYQANLEKEKQRKQKESSLRANETVIKELKQTKVNKLQSINTGIKGLSFASDGYRYENTSSEMLSGSQKLEMSNKLASLYSNEFKVQLIDRGESIGEWENVEVYQKDATENEKTILMSWVGENPAKGKKEIGVFVVENGKIS